MSDCELCSSPGGVLLWRSRQCRIVRVEHPDYPGYCRVIWQSHVREMTDLSGADRQIFMSAVFAVESALRSLCQPDKINLACLGNMTPHLHWHVIPRWQNDRHFPEPIWGTPQRTTAFPQQAIDDRKLVDSLRQILPLESL